VIYRRWQVPTGAAVVESKRNEIGVGRGVAEVGCQRGGIARSLTVREREVLRRMADGESTRQIAEGLAIAPSTVRTHAQNVLVKLQARSRIEATATAVEVALFAPAGDHAEQRGSGASAALDALTPREAEVLRCVAAGIPRVAVAERLYLSPHTVRTHLRNVLTKLAVHSTLAAVAVARRAGAPAEGGC
jgi:DNA-binding CsgD family transcriptional regulator